MWLARGSGKKAPKDITGKKGREKKPRTKKRGKKARGKKRKKKAREMARGENQLITLCLIGWKSGVRFLSRSKCAEDQKSFHTISVIFDAWLNTVSTVIKVECIYFFIREVLDSWDALKSLYPIQNDSQFVLRVPSSFSLTRKKEGLGTRLTGRVSALLT